MKFAVLDADRDSLELAAAAIERGHELIGLFGSAAGDADRLAEFSRFPRFDGWEELASAQIADAVFVGRGADEEARMERLRKLVQAKVAVLAVHPALDAMLYVFELDMIRQEGRSVLLPFAQIALHPAVERWRSWVAMGAESPIGRVEQVACQRAAADRSRGAVLRRLTQDAEVIRSIAGEQSKIAAMATGAGGGDARFSTLGVQITGASPILARWSIEPARDGDQFTVALFGERGKSTLRIADDGSSDIETITRVGAPTLETFDDWRPTMLAVERLEAAIRGESVRPDWRDACRDAEITEAAVRGVERGRTVDLHNEEASEQGTFKGMMAAGGCLLLTLGLCVALVTAMIAPIFQKRLGVDLLAYWPHALALLLGGFLLLQTLHFVFPTEASKSGPRS